MQEKAKHTKSQVAVKSGAILSLPVDAYGFPWLPVAQWDLLRLDDDVCWADDGNAVFHTNLNKRDARTNWIDMIFKMVMIIEDNK